MNLDKKKLPLRRWVAGVFVRAGGDCGVDYRSGLLCVRGHVIQLTDASWSLISPIHRADAAAEGGRAAAPDTLGVGR